MRKIIVLFIGMMTSLTAVAQTKMTKAEVAVFKQAVETEAKKMTSLASDFEETKYVKVLKNSSKSTGIFRYKNDKLLWQYNAPKKSALLFLGNKMTMKSDKGRISTIDLNKNKRFRQLQQLMMASYNGTVFDEDNFTINYFKDTTQKWAVLTPKSKDMGKHIKEVTFWFKNGENAVSEIKIVENNDDYSVIRLMNRKINETISDNVFQL